MSLVETTRKAHKSIALPKEANNIFMKCGAAIYTRKMEAALSFKMLLEKKINKKTLDTKLPFCTPSRDPGHVWVYPNIPPLYTKYPSYYSAKYYIPYDLTFKDLFERYKTEMADEKKAIKWKTQSTGIKFVIKREKMLVSRLLTRYLGLTEEMKDDQIRDIARWIQAEQEPPTVFFCDKPDDYYDMFKVPCGSCMVNNEAETTKNYHGGGAGSFWADLKKQRMFPSVWYHYNPHTQGVYASKNGQPVARCFLLFDANGKELGYTNCHSRFPSDGAQLTEYLNRKGHKPTYGNVSVTKEFRIPGVESRKGLVCPLPHCDNVNKPFNVSFDTDTSEFVFTAKGKGVTISDTYSWCGYIPASLKVADARAF